MDRTAVNNSGPALKIVWFLEADARELWTRGSHDVMCASPSWTWGDGLPLASMDLIPAFR